MQLLTDWNLLPALHALLSTQSVSRAADALNLSVPATSRTLDRCRRAFDDPLLVRSGRGLVITPTGEELLGRLELLMQGVRAITESGRSVDPSTWVATLVVRANETIIATFGGPLLARVAAEAPRVQVRFAIEGPDDLEALRQRQADLAIGSYGDITPDHESLVVGTEILVGVIDGAHPIGDRRITPNRFASMRHVVTSRRGISRGPVDDWFESIGRSREVIAVVPSFSTAMAMCVGTDLTTLVPSRLAAVLARSAGLRVYSPPLQLPSVEGRAIWHKRSTNDPVHRWFRELVADLAQSNASTSDRREPLSLPRSVPVGNHARRVNGHAD